MFPDEQNNSTNLNSSLNYQASVPIEQVLQAQSTNKIVSENQVQTKDGSTLFFNSYKKISHKQKKQLASLLFRNTGMKIVGTEQTFEFPEVLMENVENQAEVLVAIFWNTEEFWRTGEMQGNYWSTRPTEAMDADIVDYMFEQVQNRVDPLKSKELRARAAKQINE